MLELPAKQLLFPNKLYFSFFQLNSQQQSQCSQCGANATSVNINRSQCSKHDSRNLLCFSPKLRLAHKKGFPRFMVFLTLLVIFFGIFCCCTKKLGLETFQGNEIVNHNPRDMET